MAKAGRKGKGNRKETGNGKMDGEGKGKGGGERGTKEGKCKRMGKVDTFHF